MAVSDVAILDLLLTASYTGGSAFGALSRDVETLTANVDAAAGGLNGFTVAAGLAKAAGDTLIVSALAIGAAFTYSITEAAKFDQVKTHIEAVTGATQAQTKAIQDQTLAAAKLYGLDPTQLLQGTYNVLSAGVPVPQFIAGNMTQAFAAAYKARSEANQGMDYGSFVLDMTHAAQASRVAPQDYGQFLALSTFIENHSNLTTSSISDFLGRASPVLSQYGISLRDQLLATGTLGNLGFMGSAPGREFASGIQQLLSPTGQKELRALGINPNSLYGPGGQLLTPETIGQIITAHTAGLSPAQQSAAYNSLFGRVGERTWLPFMSAQGQQQYAALAGKMPSGAQALPQLLQLAGSLSNTVAGKFLSILSTLKSIGIVVGQQITPTIKQWETHIQNILDKLQKFLTTHPNFAPDLLKALPGMLGGGLALKGAAPILSWLGQGVKVGGKDSTHAAVIADAIGKRLGGLFGAGRGMGQGFAGGIGRGVNFLRAGEWNGDEWLASKGAGFLESHFPTAVAGRGAELAARAAGFNVTNPTGAFLGGMGKDIGGAIGGGFGNLLTGVKGLVAGIPSLLGMLPALAGAFAAVAIPVALVAAVIAVGVLAFTRYRKETMQAISLIGDQLTPIFQFFGAIVQTAWAQIQAAWQAAQPAIDTAMKAFLDNLPKIAPLFEVLGAVVGAVLAVVVGVLAGVVNAFLSALPPIINFFSGVIQYVGGFFNLLIGLFTLNGAKIQQGWDDMWSGLWNMLVGAVTAIWNALVGFVQGIAGFFGNLWGMVTGAAKKGTKDTHDVVTNNLSGLATDSQTPLNTLLTNGTNTFNGLNTNATSILGQMATNGCDAFGALQNCASNHTDQMVNLVYQKLYGARDAATKLGNSLAQGVAGGMTADAYLVIQAAKNLADGAMNTFGQKLKISSPSKVFYGFGQNTVAGYVQGIADNHGLIHSAWDNLTAPHVTNNYFGENGPAQGGGAGSSTFWETRMIQSIRESRYGPMQPVTNRNLLSQIDYQYRYAYQATA